MLEVKWNYQHIDNWQKEVLQATGNIVLMCGRQVGKSEVMSKKIAEFLLNNPKKKLLICSGVERQAAGLYNKVLRLIERDHLKELKQGKNKPLKTIFHLKNGSCLITEPIGLDGSGARQHTLDGIILEEMQLIPEEAFAAVTPMLFTTGGFIWMLGTAWATEGYVYERLSDPAFTVFRINSEQVAEGRPEPSRTIMLKHLEEERVRLTEAQYAQEYLAIPSANVRQIFNDALIKKVCVAKRLKDIPEETICGLDPAGLGDDEGSISILTYDENNGKMRQVEHEITSKLYTTQTTQRIVDLERIYNFKKIYVDDGGVGFGVFSELLKEDDTKFKTIALNNSARPLDYREEKQKRILGDEMIFNLLVMMEKGQIELLDDPEIRESLKSYKFENDKENKRVLITSNYNHPVQSIMRAAWHAQRKDLKLSVFSIKV
jgi:hypothetical protein